MTAEPIDSGTFTFADGDAGHICNLGSAPDSGDLDVLCVNSNTVVDTPSGFLLAPTSVGGQGAYIFRRIASGGEGSTVTIDTSGDHNTQVSWSRWTNINAADDASRTAADAISGTSSPAHTTNALAEADELVIAFAALHQTGSPTPASPVWSSGYTALSEATQGTGGSGVVGLVAYRTDGGTAAESPSVSWTNAASDRYMLVLTFTTTEAAAPAEVTLTPATLTLAPVAVTPVPQPVTVALTPAAVTLAGVALTAAPQAVTVALTPAAIALAAVALSAAPGTVIVSLTPAVLTLAAVALSIAGRRPTVTRPNSGLVVRANAGYVIRT